MSNNTPIAGLDSLSFPVTVSLNKIITYSPGKKLEYKNGGWYYDNKYLDDSELEVFLTQTCWDANSHKTLGDICGVLGWDVLLPSGAILLITGAYRADIAVEHGISYDKKTIGFLIGGLTATTLGIVCVITKHTMKKKITNTFNQECGRIPQNNNSSNLSLGFSPFGASITYSF